MSLVLTLCSPHAALVESPCAEWVGTEDGRNDARLPCEPIIAQHEPHEAPPPRLGIKEGWSGAAVSISIESFVLSIFGATT